MFNVIDIREDSQNFPFLNTIVKHCNGGLGDVLNDELKKTEPEFIIDEIKQLNPNVEFKVDKDRGAMYCGVAINDLKLPEGFYYSQEKGVTNKDNTQSGLYGTVHIYPMEYYNSSFL